MTKVNIDVVSDVMCPWCFIGKRRLESALQDMEDIDADVRWRPFQLDPTLPPAGRDRNEYLEAKFGGKEKARKIYGTIEEAGRADGIAFNFDAMEVSPNTLDAHRVIRWSATAGEGIQQKLVERLFELFFLEGADIGDHTVLLDAAERAGMDRAVVAALLPTESDRKEVSEEIAVAQRLGVTGVPCFIIDNKYALMGAQPPETLVAAIRKAATENSEHRTETA